MRFSLFIFILLASLRGFGQTLFVSDIDDTIKVSHVRNYFEAAQYAFDSKTRFLGMAEVYQALKADSSDADFNVVYLSRAPGLLLGDLHQRFLKNGGFPEGLYIPRNKFSGKDHKLKFLRHLIDQYKPRTVILVGDDTEADADVYRQIQSEYEGQGLIFKTYVRLIEGSGSLTGQSSFLTSADLAWKLSEEGLLSEQTRDALGEQLIPLIANPEAISDKHEIPVPDFVRCQGYRFSPDLSMQHNFWSELVSFVQRRCQTPGR